MHSETHLSFPCDPQASDTLDNVKAKLQDKDEMANVSCSIITKPAAELTAQELAETCCGGSIHSGLWVVVAGCRGRPIASYAYDPNNVKCAASGYCRCRLGEVSWDIDVAAGRWVVSHSTFSSAADAEHAARVPMSESDGENVEEGEEADEAEENQ